MMKLTMLTVCLLAVSALAMPVAEDERKDQSPAPASVVPLEKSKPATSPVEAAPQPTEARAIDADKKIDAIPKKAEEKPMMEKKEEIKIKEEEKKPELLEPKKAEEEKKIVEEPKKLEEPKKPEAELKPEKSEQAIVEPKELMKETPLAGAPEIPAVAPGAPEIAIEPAQAKNVEEAPLLVEKKASEPAKELPKPDEMRVTREAEEALKKTELDKKPLPLAEEKPLEKLTAEPTLKAAEALPEAAKPKEEPKIEATVAAAVEEPKKIEETKPVVEAIEAKSVEPLKPAVAQDKEQRSEDSPVVAAVAPVENPVVEQRSEVIMPIAKEAPAVVESERAAIPSEEQKVAPAAIEKVAKLADEAKAEELPQPQQVKDAKIAAEPIVKAEPAALPLAEKKEDIIPAAVAEKKLPEPEKKEEKLAEKKDSSEEKDDSSEEKKLEEKLAEKKKDEDKKDMSSEEKDSSEEELKLKKDEMKKEAAIAAESSLPAAEAKAPAS